MEIAVSSLLSGMTVETGRSQVMENIVNNRQMLQCSEMIVIPAHSQLFFWVSGHKQFIWLKQNKKSNEEGTEI